MMWWYSEKSLREQTTRNYDKTADDTRTIHSTIRFRQRRLIYYIIVTMIHYYCGYKTANFIWDSGTHVWLTKGIQRLAGGNWTWWTWRRGAGFVTTRRRRRLAASLLLRIPLCVSDLWAKTQTHWFISHYSLHSALALYILIIRIISYHITLVMKYYSVFLLFNLFTLHLNPDIITHECTL